MSEPVRILLLYGSLRATSYCRRLVEEAGSILRALGAETRVFDPAGLPLPDDVSAGHPKVVELRALADWSDGQVWCSPEYHGSVSSVLKAQLDWFPPPARRRENGAGRTLALLQVCGGAASFNTLNELRIVGRSMRMLTICGQVSIARARDSFGSTGLSAYDERQRLAQAMEELQSLTRMVRFGSPPDAPGGAAADIG